MLRLGIIAYFIFSGQVSYCQISESYAYLKEGIFKTEVGSFAKAADLPSSVDSTNKIKLTEIKLKRCSTDFVHFESGDIIALDKLVSIYSNIDTPLISRQSDSKVIWGTTGNTPARRISEVRYMHYKYLLILPATAIGGLYEPKFCINTTRKNKLRGITSSNCKVYQSLDKRRVYIYMLNGNGSEQYEITWVIQDSRYLMRILDKVKYE